MSLTLKAVHASEDKETARRRTREAVKKLGEMDRENIKWRTPDFQLQKFMSP